MKQRGETIIVLLPKYPDSDVQNSMTRCADKQGTNRPAIKYFIFPKENECNASACKLNNFSIFFIFEQLFSDCSALLGLLNRFLS